MNKIYLNILLITAVNLIFSSCQSAGSINNGHADDVKPMPAERHYQNLERVYMDGAIPQQIKKYKAFTVNFNASDRTPNYVAWELLGRNTQGSITRSDNFHNDPDIKNCPNPDSYKKTGFSRGHMFPAAEAKWDGQVMNDCFSMANMCPQLQALNGGAWKTLEEKERLWAQRDSAIIIVAGPIYRNSDKLRVGPQGIRVPSAFFKAIIAPYIDEPRGIAFVYPNDRAPGNMQNYAMSIDQLEAITGFDFFPALPDNIEHEIESKFNFHKWNEK